MQTTNKNNLVEVCTIPRKEILQLPSNHFLRLQWRRPKSRSHLVDERSGPKEKIMNIIL